MGTISVRADNQFQAKIRKGGYKRTQTFTTKKEAQDWITITESKILKGETVDIKKIKKLTLDEIFDEFLTKHTLPYGKKNRIEKLKKEIGKTVLLNFKTAGLEYYIKDKLSAEIPHQKKTEKVHSLFNNYKKKIDGVEVARTFSPSTIRKYYYDIKNILEWHSKIHDYPFDEKPFKDVRPPLAWAEPRDRRLHDGELEKLLSACDLMYKNQQALKCLLNFQIYSCMRIGESLLMKWQDIRIDKKNPQNSIVFVPKKNQKTKNKKGAQDRYISMRPELYELIKVIDKLPKNKNGKVFHFWKNSSTFGQRFKVLVKNAGSEDLTIHDFRHEGISWFFENTNLTDIEISNISGHIELNVLKRYANLRPKMTGAKLWANVQK